MSWTERELEWSQKKLKVSDAGPAVQDRPGRLHQNRIDNIKIIYQRKG